MIFETTNPYTNKTINTYESLSQEELNQKLELSSQIYQEWQHTPIAKRTELLATVASLLRSETTDLAKTISLEMGKPITESKSEIEKCAWVCEYYAEHAKDFLKDEVITTDASESFVRHSPIGSVFAVMPWNFPFWQVFRFAAPTLSAGNTALLKHAPNVFGCAQKIEELFLRAGYPKGAFQNLIIHQDDTENVISHDAVKAITLTGSESAGSSVAQLASKHIKKSVLELGGNNAFIVLEDADLELALDTAVKARMMNSGQSCIAAKRFILVESIYDKFVEGFIKRVKKLKTGDPMLDNTEIGPLARIDLAEKLQNQVNESIKAGAKLLLGGQQNDCFHEPTVLGNVTKDMPAFIEETFGPLAAMIKVKSADEAFRYANDSRFGLGVSLFTKDTSRAHAYINNVSDGAFFVNELVKSDPRLPFGGTKASGFGRELAKDGILEFVNRKTVYIK
ncbi:NAD-dependent succinate-semialdehyde dehydrogenase [Psychroflexus tropicus]|uniref:NAD-dependent succinate-semialdehyde dehydrogenase n=1 Tax=Psychroflexus tropicus TaxID=197345 RepID=UPI0003654B1E|nr:NAD-dependent succinate-semialdehyde dehydrogenase [Psychroflexus tropicus]